MALALFFGLSFAAIGMASNWPARPNFRLALLDAIAEAGLTQQDVYAPLGYSKSQWAKIMRGEPSHRLPNFDRMEDLPPAVWDCLLPKIAYVVWQRRQLQQSDLERSA